MELWDVYDKHGNFTGAVKTSGDIIHEGEYQLAASAWIINPEGKLLIQKRAAVKKTNPNTWNITGGMVRSGEDSRHGCIREVREEIGIKLDIKKIELLYRAFGKDMIFDDYVIILDFPLSDAVLQADEVSEIKWASIDEIKEHYNNGEFMFTDITKLDDVGAYIGEHIHKG
ncbi:MAG: NUDIX domain-containing protein [Defluviitaleaceae bacterium]|nr:NUDIX domain-containing protein [Defluviitaleaceae bacterium]MCL2837325.1 NUDIX domain-containing protein [Defluviitaleaceae bacterium]